MSSPRCVFCEIVTGERDAELVLDETRVMAFLDHRPLFPGHVLVVPRAHRETVHELPGDELPLLFDAVQRLAAAVERACRAEGSFLAVNNRVSQSVPHLHVHVVPRRRRDGLRGFFWPRNDYRDAGHRAEIAEAIRAALEAPSESG